MFSLSFNSTHFCTFLSVCGALQGKVSHFWGSPWAMSIYHVYMWHRVHIGLWSHMKCLTEYSNHHRNIQQAITDGNFLAWKSWSKTFLVKNNKKIPMGQIAQGLIWVPIIKWLLLSFPAMDSGRFNYMNLLHPMVSCYFIKHPIEKLRWNAKRKWKVHKEKN